MSRDGPDLDTLADLDRMIHEPARLAIMSVLYVVDTGDFVFLLQQTGLTRGNLSSHLSKLEEAGYLSIKKEFVRKVPRTVLRLTDKGRKAFARYTAGMRRVVESLPTGRETVEARSERASRENGGLKR